MFDGGASARQHFQQSDSSLKSVLSPISVKSNNYIKINTKSKKSLKK